MKEITIWDNNPRVMWVWDDNSEKVKRKVLFIVPGHLYAMYPVIAEAEGCRSVQLYSHCAEIEDGREKLMTNSQLARWLREKPDREYKRDATSLIGHDWKYTEDNSDAEVPCDVYVREGDSPWYVPFLITI